MKKVTVDKATLLATLQTNREAHRAMFLKAQEKYREEVIKELDAMLEAARNGSKIIRAVRLPEPQDYTDEFDNAIAMVEWEVGETCDLDQREFAQYVRNEWGWMQAFAASTEAYLVE